MNTFSSDLVTHHMTVLETRGWDCLHFDGDPSNNQHALETLLHTLGQPIHVYHDLPFWKPLPADPSRPPGRAGGIGLNSLHIDCVNWEYPPDFVALLCIQPDPLGGGASLVVDVTAIEEALTTRTLRVLKSATFTYGSSPLLSDVGRDINPFMVFQDPGPVSCRYTGRLLGERPSETWEALLELDRVLMASATVLPLQAGDALIVDQTRTLHGRLPLGQGQEKVRPNERRILVQAYARRLQER